MNEENVVVEDEMDMEETGYTPRNSIVAAKERLYDKTNLTVGQVDKFIAVLVLAIVALTIAGSFLS